jgi:hypothetical protein
MEKEEHINLITDFIDGQLSPEGKIEFEKLIAKGEIDKSEVEAMANFKKEFTSTPEPIPSPNLKANFYRMLSEEQSKQGVKTASLFDQLNAFLFGRTVGKLAFGLSLMIIGLVVGKNFLNNTYQTEISDLNSQMTEMKEMMMIAMLEKESVSDRLKGVQMSSELSSSNQKVIDALFLTLNNDRSANVRIASLNTLAEYANDPQIREGLINSIAQQKSPLVQVALATLMVELQEKKAVNEFNSILNDDFTPEEVKTSLKERIEKIL